MSVVYIPSGRWRTGTGAPVSPGHVAHVLPWRASWTLACDQGLVGRVGLKGLMEKAAVSMAVKDSGGRPGANGRGGGRRTGALRDGVRAAAGGSAAGGPLPGRPAPAQLGRLRRPHPKLVPSAGRLLLAVRPHPPPAARQAASHVARGAVTSLPQPLFGVLSVSIFAESVSWDSHLHGIRTCTRQRSMPC